MKDKMDLHTHTIASGHAYNTRNEMIQVAYKRGMEIFAITEHGPAMPGSCHEIYFVNYRVLPRKYETMTVLYGVELNIMDYEGNVDLPESVLKQMDITLASIHPPCFVSGSIHENTTAYLKAMENPYINIIAHPDDSRFPVDYELLVKAARDYHVLLEVNNTSLSPKGYRQNARENYTEMLKKCMKYQVPIVMDSDAHVDCMVGEHTLAVELLESVEFPEELIINSHSEKLYNYINYGTA
ncbi:MAG: phosphatase [Lachnospiraceae bacterium]|jgi:putative hydrolase|nr:phosphatase [Lachnospiraceae bacterium]